MSEPDEMDEDGRWFADDDAGPGGIGCCECDEGWKHGCMDDLCRGCNEAQDCDFGRPCKHCNPDGEYIL